MFFLLAGCASVDNKMKPVKYDDFSIPDKIAKKFEVSNTQTTSTEIEPTKKKSQRKNSKSKQSRHKKAKLKAKQKKQKQFRVENTGQVPFYPGELIEMDITYLGVTAGTLKIEVLPHKFINDRKVYHIRGHGSTTSVFALFYKVNDFGETFMDHEGLFTHKFVMRLDETRQQRELLELYDQKKHQLYFWDRQDHVKRGFRLRQFTKEVMHYTQDAISAAYYLRTLPLVVGKTYSFPVATNGKQWEVKAEVVRKEKLMTSLGEIPAIVIKPKTHFEGHIKQKGDIFFWLSDDENRSFLKIDAKVKIGKVIAYVKKIKHGKKE